MRRGRDVGVSPTRHDRRRRSREAPTHNYRLPQCRADSRVEIRAGRGSTRPYESTRTAPQSRKRGSVGRGAEDNVRGRAPPDACRRHHLRRWLPRRGRHGAPDPRTSDMPATFFLAPGLISRECSAWWECLGWAITSASVRQLHWGAHTLRLDTPKERDRAPAHPFQGAEEAGPGRSRFGDAGPRRSTRALWSVRNPKTSSWDGTRAERW